MKRKAKKKAKAKKAARKYTTVSLYLNREQRYALDQIAEFADRSVDDVMTVLIGVALFMGRSTAVMAAAAPPQVAPDGEPPAPSPPPETPAVPPDDAAPSPSAQP